MDFLHRTWAEIDINALVHNFKTIKQNANGSQIMAVVKADAYGHSVEPIVSALQENGVNSFAVSNISEAFELRSYGVKGHILILGYTPAECVKDLCDNSISQAVYSLEYAEELSVNAEKNNCRLNVHLKLDTGMGRIGFNCRNDRLPEIQDAIISATLPCLFTEGVFSHFSDADNLSPEGKEFTLKQLQLFKSAVKKLNENGINPSIIHSNNSAATFATNDDFTNFCRPGIVLYGLSPADSVKADGLRPIMTFKSVISMVKKITKGESLSY